MKPNRNEMAYGTVPKSLKDLCATVLQENERQTIYDDSWIAEIRPDESCCGVKVAFKKGKWLFDDAEPLKEIMDEFNKQMIGLPMDIFHSAWALQKVATPILNKKCVGLMLNNLVIGAIEAKLDKIKEKER